jgi:hypothetical protein
MMHPPQGRVARTLILLAALAVFSSPAVPAEGALARSAAALGPSPSGNLVTVSLLSDQNGQIVHPGQEIPWAVRVHVVPGGSLGLSLIAVDLVQDATNPETLDLRPGSIGSDAMLVFDRPMGFANPGDDPWGSGFGGTPVDDRLVQIGGAQNVFGVAPECLGPEDDVCMGQNVSVVTGIGQGAEGELVATGFVVAGAAPGRYRLRIGDVLANVLRRTALAPWASPTERAPVRLGDDAEISFTVQ